MNQILKKFLKWLKKEITGLEFIKIINEPTALAYGLEKKNKLIKVDENDNFFELNAKTLNNKKNFRRSI